MKKTSSLSRIQTIASIRASLSRLYIHEQDTKRATTPKPARKVGQKRGSSHIGASPQKRFEPNIQVQRKRPSQTDKVKEEEFLMKLKRHFDGSQEEEKKVEKPKQEGIKKERAPRKPLLVPGKMVLGSKTETDVEKSKIIEKQKKEKSKGDRAKVDDNSWIHTSESTVNSYKPTVLPFFNTFSTERKLKKEVKRLKAQGASQKQIEKVLADFKQQPTEKSASQILLQEGGEPDQDELFYFQLPTTLPFKEKLSEIQSGTCLGKLKVYKSGKAKLVFDNGLELEIRRGIEAAFFQEAIVLGHEQKEARMLGSVGNKLVLSPELKSLFDQN